MRLIDAEILFEKVGNIKPKNKSEYELLDKFMNMITYSPTVERPHGEWIKERLQIDERHFRSFAKCKVCGCEFKPYSFAVKEFDFCPKCGADMRGETE